MCYSFNVQGINFRDFNVCRVLVESIVRLNDWIFDEIAYYQEDPKLSKKIVRIRNKLSINL